MPWFDVLLRFVDDHPKSVALTLLVVIVVESTGSGCVIKGKNEQFSVLEQRLLKKDEVIRVQEQRLSEKDEVIAVQEQRLSAKDDRISAIEDRHKAELAEKSGDAKKLKERANEAEHVAVFVQGEWLTFFDDVAKRLDDFLKERLPVKQYGEFQTYWRELETSRVRERANCIRRCNTGKPTPNGDYQRCVRRCMPGLYAHLRSPVAP